jgi:hypothetical protein
VTRCDINAVATPIINKIADIGFRMILVSP